MDLVLRTVNCALFAESFQLVVALGVGISLFQFSVDSILNLHSDFLSWLFAMMTK